MSLQEANRNTPQHDQVTPATLESWKEIAAYLQRDAKTARKWEKEEGLPIHRHTHNSRSSVYAYPAEIDRWRATRKVVAEPAARPLWKIPAFAVTMFLCLLMVGNGARPQAAEAQQGQTRTLVCSGADCEGQMLSPTGRLVRPHVEKGCCTHISPDGSRVAYTRRSGPFSRESAATEEVIVADIDGAKARTIYRGGDSYAWSADGKRLLIGVLLPDQPTNVANLLWVDIATGAVQKLPTVHANLDVAKVSPDGKYVAFNASKDGDAEENVYITASDGSGEAIVSPSAAYQEPIGWTPDSRHLLIGQFGDGTRSLWAATVSGGKLSGAAFNTHMDLSSNAGFLGVSRSGELYYKFTSRGSDIFTATMDPSTGKVTSARIPVPSEHTGDNVLPRWAPDSRRLAHVWAKANASPANPREFFVYSFDTDKEMRVDEAAVFNPNTYCWSRDSSSILYNDARNPRERQVVRFSLGTNQVAPVFPGAAPFSLRTCSNDAIAGIRSSAIEVRNLVNGSEKEIYRYSPGTQGNGLIVISHDGRRVAFPTSDSKTSTVHIVPSEGGPVRDVVTATAPAEFPGWGIAWSPDDRFLYFMRRPDAKSPYELFRVSAAGGAAESMGLKGEDLSAIDIAPDGTRIAFSIGANVPQIWSTRNLFPLK